MTLAGQSAGVRVYDSFAHHPDEVSADLTAAHTLVDGDGRVLVVFQPSDDTRLNAFGAEFGKALAGCNEVVLTDGSCARETQPEPHAGMVTATQGDSSAARHTGQVSCRAG
ncbi:cyanophycin synthetase [Streptomyces sp. NPDC006356]